MVRLQFRRDLRTWRVLRFVFMSWASYLALCSSVIFALTVFPLLFLGCSDDKFGSDTSSGKQISFRLQGNLPSSRTTGTTVDNINAFVVNAQLYGDNDGDGTADGILSENAGVLFTSQTVARLEGTVNAFDYSPKRYYPDAAEEAYYSAYSPVTGNVNKGFKDRTDDEINTITYTVPKPSDKGDTTQEDLLVAYTPVIGAIQTPGAAPVSRGGFDTPVSLNFKHALSRVFVRASNNNREPVVIKELSLHNLYSTGTLEIDGTSYNDGIPVEHPLGDVSINEGYYNGTITSAAAHYKVLWTKDNESLTSYPYVLLPTGVSVPAETDKLVTGKYVYVVGKDQGMLVLPQTTVNTNNDAEIEELTEVATDFYVEVTYRLSNIERTVRAAFTDIKVERTGAKEGLTFEMGRQYALTLGFEDTDINFDIKVEAWDDNTEEPAYAATTVIFNANKPAEASDSDAVEHIHDPNSGFIYGKALPALYYGDNPAPDTTPPSLSGYIFQGYYDSPELGAKQYYDSSLTPQKIFDTDGDDEPDAVWDKAGPSCTLYAQWKVFNPSNAQSNIYFQPDAGETEIGSLTFSEDDPSKSGYQGLYFRWGSLIGVSAAVEGSDAFSAAYLYIPDVSAGANAGKYYKVKSSEISSYYGESNTDIGEAVRAYATAGGGSAWGNIPSATDTDLGGSVATGRDKSPLTDASDQTLYEKYMGDICKFLSDKKDTNDSGLTKKWVMPVSNAFGAGSGGPLNSVNGYIHIGDGYTYKNESGSTPWGGFADLSADGTGSTATARLTYTLATNEKVIFPAAGGRGGGQLYNVGSYGYYWSSSVSDASYAYCLYFFSGSVSPGSSDSRTYGFPVRCVQEF